MLVQELGPDVRELKVRRYVVDGDCSFRHKLSNVEVP